MTTKTWKDWGELSEIYDNIRDQTILKNIVDSSEAQTRFDIIDRVIKEILQWKHGQIVVEESTIGKRKGHIDYVLRSGDDVIVVEAKKSGATFPSPTKKRNLKRYGSILNTGEIGEAIIQAEEYAKNKGAKVIIVTNGECWCISILDNKTEKENQYATLLFPFNNILDGELLYNYLACQQVENNSLQELYYNPNISEEKRLLKIVKDADARIDRNNIADHIGPALDSALYSESLINNAEILSKCFVSTEGRTKFDTTLRMHLVDAKPETVLPAKRIKRDKDKGEIENIITSNYARSAPPVTLIIGPVGAGKSTYLKHFELVKGKSILSDAKCHWIYIDFEEMGVDGKPRDFLYKKLKDYLLADHPRNPTDYVSAIRPAYEQEIKGLARGPFAGLDKSKFDEKIQELINEDYNKTEPYVEKLFKFLAAQNLCVIVLDNIDLYEDESLETKVFSEGIALSKKIKSHIMVSIRDTTFVKHRNDSIFNAHELKKLWLDPPPFKSVLSKRLTYAKQVLSKKPAEITLSNSSVLEVPDLSIFFDIVQKSILNEANGKFIEAISEGDIRFGITLVRNFLTSGHINADKAIKNYIHEDGIFTFPFQEIFKGCMLGQWKYYKEERAEALNIYDSRLGAANLLLLRLWLLKLLYLKAQDENTVNVEVKEIIDAISIIGASEDQICLTLNILFKHRLIKTNTAEKVIITSVIHLTVAGGYYLNRLSKYFNYVESVLYDTAIYDKDLWDSLSSITQEIENESSIPERMKKRKDRLLVFIAYLKEIEGKMLSNSKIKYLQIIEEVEKSITAEANRAIYNSSKYYS